jgi:threonine synthase
MRLACSECGADAASGSLFCSECSGLLEFRLDPAAYDRATLDVSFRARRSSNHPLDQSGVWRFRELLPAIAPEFVVSLRENVVPVYRGQTSASYADATSLSYLHLGMNPTASFKDAGMTVAISRARATGARVAICASTGNTAASMAAYAARAGMTAIVLVPAGGISEAKMAQTLDYGASVAAVDGDFDRALEIVRTLDPKRVAIVNSVNPYRIEGQKCAAFILLESRDWKPPDWLVLPGGNLGNASAFGKGFREARDLGFIARIPKIAVIQAAGAAPFANLFRDGGELVPVKADTTATAIKIGAPASWRKALVEVRGSKGTVTTVTDDEVGEARAVIGRDGIGCEPASAASLAGLRKLRADGTIGRDEDVVLVLTGHVLKDSAYAATYHASSARLANAIVPAGDERSLQGLIDRALAVHA